MLIIWNVTQRTEELNFKIHLSFILNLFIKTDCQISYLKTLKYIWNN